MSSDSRLWWLQANQNDVQGIDPDVRGLVYTQAVASGGLDAYTIMQQLYLNVSLHNCLHCYAAALIQCKSSQLSTLLCSSPT